VTVIRAAVATDGMTVAALYSTNVSTATTLPIGTWSGQEYRTMARVIVPVIAGDMLDCDGRARVTNDAPEPRYTVGVSTALWAYDCDDGLGSSGPWTQIDVSTGDNVDPARHHMPVAITAVYTVPATWPPGHRIVIVLRSDAASTQARANDALTVDPLTRLTVRRWTAPISPQEQSA
jgi:hypothetical protein